MINCLPKQEQIQQQKEAIENEQIQQQKFKEIDGEQNNNIEEKLNDK